nr:MAG TPA: hypothetical protein [Inoviridae sp.]
MVISIYNTSLYFRFLVYQCHQQTIPLKHFSEGYQCTYNNPA